jgi:hypothetical protein
MKQEVTRVAVLPGVGRYLARLDARMKTLGLIQETAFRDGNETPQGGGGEKNPFEVTGTAQDKNPFENAKPGRASDKGMANKPGGARDEVALAALESALQKMQSTEFFTRQNGVREMLSVKVDESRKTEVLDVLGAVLDDGQMHFKGDAFKLFKKWAATKEDRERIGKYMEGLLADLGLKKDVIKYVAENKIASAAPELAKLLKDGFERLEVARALIAIGPEAGQATLPFVTDLDPQVRKMAIEVLAQIGTKECIPELQKVQGDRMVGIAARQAIKVIQGRNSKEKEKDK